MIKLKQLRTDSGYSQAYVASILGITQQAYANYESGKREPDNKSLQKLADIFDVSVDYLLGRTDAKKEPEGSVAAQDSHHNVVRIAGRDGSYKERHLTDSQLAALEAVIDQMPDLKNDDV